MFAPYVLPQKAINHVQPKYGIELPYHSIPNFPSNELSCFAYVGDPNQLGYIKECG
jgi:hypothetical protein